MNKLTIVSTVIVCLLCASMTSCNTAVTTNPASEGIKGTWTFESVTAEDGTQDEESTEFTRSLGVAAEVVFDADGTGTLRLFGETQWFTWSRVDDANARIVLEDDSANVVLENGKLKIEGQQEDGSAGYLVFVPSSEDAGAEDANADPAAANPEA